MNCSLAEGKVVADNKYSYKNYLVFQNNCKNCLMSNYLLKCTYQFIFHLLHVLMLIFYLNLQILNHRSILNVKDYKINIRQYLMCNDNSLIIE